jgi:transposase
MKALRITHPDMTRESLLKMAEEIPGAWVGIRIAGYLLMLSGWKSTQVAELFDLSRLGVVKWIRNANQRGLASIEDRPRSGRPARIDAKVLKELDQVLSKSPKKVGISRAKWDGVMVVEYLKRHHQEWDGVMVVEYLKRHHQVNIHVRHAQRLIRKLGYSLRQPVYRYVQASEEGIQSFRKTLKKTPPGDPK